MEVKEQSMRSSREMCKQGFIESFYYKRRKVKTRVVPRQMRVACTSDLVFGEK